MQRIADLLSLKSRILNYLQDWRSAEPDKWINGGEVERLALEAGYKASNASRRLRELAEEGHLEHRLAKGTVEYRWVI